MKPNKKTDPNSAVCYMAPFVIEGHVALPLHLLPDGVKPVGIVDDRAILNHSVEYAPERMLKNAPKVKELSEAEDADRQIDYLIRATGKKRFPEYEAAKEAMAALVGRGEVFHVGKIAELALGILATAAEAGSAEAAKRLTSAAAFGAERLNAVAAKTPKLFQSSAAGMSRWPVMRSRHPHMTDSDDVLKAVTLGESLNVQLDQHSKWKPDKAGRIAFRLLRYMLDAWNEDAEFDEGGDVPTMKAALKPFDKDSASKWWRFAEMAFLHTYPQPQEIPELDALVTTPSRRKSPGRRKQRILDLIGERFRNMAPL
jgi:hypothetical protein